jgi:hypothetical protein
MEKTGITEKFQRRGFLARLLAGLSGTAALLLIGRRGQTTEKKPVTSDYGPILYHRNEETERYYRTLYR